MRGVLALELPTSESHCAEVDEDEGRWCNRRVLDGVIVVLALELPPKANVQKWIRMKVDGVIGGC